MNKILFIGFVSIGFVILSSCKKTDTGPTSLSATINGVTYTTTNVTESALSGSYDFFSSGSNGANLSLYLLTVSAGTYPLTTSTPGMGYVSGSKTYANGFSSRHTVSQGSIIITDNSNSSISGTFSGTLYNTTNPKDSVNIINGQFTNLVYQ